MVSGFVNFTFPANVELGYSVLSTCEKLEYAEFEEGCKTTGSSTFYNCTNLKTVKFADSITEVGYGIFSGCTGIETLRYPAGVDIVEEIFDSAVIQTLIIPASVKTVGGFAFYYANIGNIVFEGEPETIEYYAFYNTKTDKLVIPSGSLKSIGYYAFYGWTSEQTICFTTSQTSVYKVSDMSSYGTFYGCDANIVFDYVPEAE